VAHKHIKGIDLMKGVSEKQARDLQLLAADASKRKKSNRHPAM
jgi:hypothetical protein